MLTVKHVLQKEKKEKESKKLNNYTSKNQTVWNNEQHLENISEYFSNRVGPPSTGFPLSSVRGPFSHRTTNR
jgi:hypothetical protein